MNHDPLPDDELLARLRQGDAEAFEQAVDQLAPAIGAFCALHAPSADTAENVVRETFVFARRNIRSLARGTPLLDWLGALAAGFLRAEIQRLRREAHGSRAEQSRLRELPELPVNPAAEMRRLGQAIEGLPAAARAVIERTYGKDETPAEIGEAIGSRPDWVRLALLRLRRELGRRTFDAPFAPAAHEEVTDG